MYCRKILYTGTESHPLGRELEVYCTVHMSSMHERVHKCEGPLHNYCWVLILCGYSVTSLNRTPSGTKEKVCFREVSGLERFYYINVQQV